MTRQPVATMTVRRAWHWGIAVISDAENGGRIPDVEADQPVSANEFGVIVLVRHAQDTENWPENGDIEWAEASIELAHWPAIDDWPTRHCVLFDGQLQTPSGHLLIGDADEDVTMPCPAGHTRLRVSADQPRSPSSVWIDLADR